MGQTHSAPPADALRFRLMARAAYFGDLEELRATFQASLVALQVSRATYLDICIQEQSHIDALTDSRDRERRSNALQDEKMEFFLAIERGRIVLGDTVLHIAVRLGHEAVVDFLLLTDHAPRPLTTTGTPAPVTRRPQSSDKKARAPRSLGKATPKSTGCGLNSTQTPNFKGELPFDVAATKVLKLVLTNVADVQEVFGVEYADEPKVHRLVHSLRRVWPLWMFEGQQEAANLVRVLYDARSSDAAFGALVKVTLSSAESFRAAVSRDGILIAAKLLAECDGQMKVARATVQKTWNTDHKRGLLFAIFQDTFRTWRHRRQSERDQAFVDFFDSAMDSWLTVAQDLRLDENKLESELLDLATLRRYDLHIWKRRLRPPPSLVDDLCMHINALEKYLDLTHLKA